MTKINAEKATTPNETLNAHEVPLAPPITRSRRVFCVLLVYCYLIELGCVLQLLSHGPSPTANALLLGSFIASWPLAGLGLHETGKSDFLVQAIGGAVLAPGVQLVRAAGWLAMAAIGLISLVAPVAIVFWVIGRLL